MLASRLKQCLQQEKLMSLHDLAQQLQQDPAMIRQLLRTWEAKGRVKKINRTPACGQTCQRCIPAMTEIYQWLDVSLAPEIHRPIFTLEKVDCSS